MPQSNSPVDVYVKLIRTAEALHTTVSRGLATERITASQFSAMKALRNHGPMPQKDIAAYLLKTAGNVTLVLDNLEKRELIRRERQTNDRRVISVTLTDKGLDLFETIYPSHLDRIKAAMDPLSNAELEHISKLLTRLHTTVNEPICAPEEAATAKAAV